jgi:hypothetical protein
MLIQFLIPLGYTAQRPREPSRMVSERRQLNVSMAPAYIVFLLSQ